MTRKDSEDLSLDEILEQYEDSDIDWDMSITDEDISEWLFGWMKE